ncbi:hybrid sensor histidine kinase/response regulator [Pelagicoccus enzymogenes]|uniref:hybrid sensor histidine kinase/response regulator n=1 Tax=Pelagicoccus enzymogenes TaxID=2773457 RepID=UPI00280D690B|nr:hybrid sensor histidine kinase/response regulator [Pelagicoccus enzymogenes]MDQ8200253.1 hybrid sensor histidine kinase/response regulator [Pelagicoccus enzymogenes]
MRDDPILIVEDDSELRVSLVDALEDRGYRATSTSSLREAWEIANRWQPSLIVSDVHLEEGDGRDLLQLLEGEKRLGGCQFVFMTGDVEGVPQRAGMNLGADDYLAKPFLLDEFIECVETRLSKHGIKRESDERLLAMMRDSVSLTVPHEFLTPLNGIIGLSEFLMNPDESMSPETVREIAKDINQCGTSLLRTVRNYLAILDVLNHPSSLSREQPLVEPEEVNRCMMRLGKAVAGSKLRSNDVCWEQLLGPIPSVRLNLDRFETVVHELLDNAFKFSRAGTKVRLSVERRENAVWLKVVDSGCGMSPEQVGKIGAFRQFDRRRYMQQGLGLGLTLAQKLLHQDGGELRIASEPSVGTTVEARWPQSA